MASGKTTWKTISDELKGQMKRKCVSISELGQEHSGHWTTQKIDFRTLASLLYVKFDNKWKDFAVS